MSLRAWLAVLMIAATAALVVGVAIERNTESDHHDAATAKTVETGGESGEAHIEGESANESGGESAATHAAESSSSEGGKEWRPFGLDIESWPFVLLAAAASLALAAAAYARPHGVGLLGLVALTMLASRYSISARPPTRLTRTTAAWWSWPDWSRRCT
jgi:hypothetical protein